MNYRKFYSKAPLRIGLAGGGTDVSPYADMFGGVVVNATISLYAHCSITIIEEPNIIIENTSTGERVHYPLQKILPYNHSFNLVIAVYNYFQKNDDVVPEGLHITVSVDAPLGSGLGTSSTLVVAVVGAFIELYQLSFSKYDIAHLAYYIERCELQLAGGRQDQYAATFGGINMMVFNPNDVVNVHNIIMNETALQQLQNNLLLYYTDTTRDSATIITEQVNNVLQNNLPSIEAMHQLKKQAQQMQIILSENNIDQMGELLHTGFAQKRQMAHNISNDFIEQIYNAAIAAGATGGKISGAGGGGFMIFYCPNNCKHNVAETILRFGGSIQPFEFTKNGLAHYCL
ncbi:dehydrogenase [Ferruginibacter yonginensis]|uniref:Dehydrogenase n=1 Tax=Ferruginibacter yonginensis TaxID=1310416 RepID=A0ABV8QMA4_9BACT